MLSEAEPDGLLNCVKESVACESSRGGGLSIGERSTHGV